MPSKSRKQHNLMAMVAHDPAAAKRLGIEQSVGREFIEADKRAGKYSRSTAKHDKAETRKERKRNARRRRGIT